MKKLCVILLFGFVFLSACQEQVSSSTSSQGTLTASDPDSVTITEIDTKSSDANPLNGYTLSPFSKYVYVDAVNKKFLVDFNFFPEGTDFDSQKKQAVIPCEYMETLDDNVSASVSAPLEEAPCVDEITLDLAKATFTFVGLEFSYESSLDVFEKDFEFKLTPLNAVDGLDNAVLEVPAEDATLENLYNSVVDKRLL